MSDEIVNVYAQEVEYIPEETKMENGMIIPDTKVVEVTTDEETAKKIAERRSEIENIIPEYPKEWQEGSDESESKGFDEDPMVNVSLKDKEIKKIIKKYKRYMKSNLKEIRRIES